MEVSIIITCWNGKKLLSQNLPSVIKAAENKENRISEVIVVDDGSTDDSVEYLKKNFRQVKILENKKNFGYAYTCNRGVREAKSSLVTILNLDVIPANDFLVSSLRHFKDDKVFSVSFNEGSFGPGKLTWKNGFIEIVASKPEANTSLTSWPSGGSSVFRKNYWQEIGGMDELFLPFYFEDIDLGIRACKSGYTCLWEPESRVEHKHESTINKDNFNMDYVSLIKQRNHLLLTWKNLDRFKLLFSHILFLLLKCLLHPGYLRILFLSLKRSFVKKDWF